MVLLFWPILLGALRTLLPGAVAAIGGALVQRAAGQISGSLTTHPPVGVSGPGDEEEEEEFEEEDEEDEEEEEAAALAPPRRAAPPAPPPAPVFISPGLRPAPPLTQEELERPHYVGPGGILE